MRIPGRAQGLILLGGVACTAAGGVVLWKDRLSRVEGPHGRADFASPQEGKVFVVTGANSGVGMAVAWNLAKRKARVYMACRDMDRCEEARKDIVLESRNKCGVLDLLKFCFEAAMS